jgi:hypothetical protein
MGSTFEVASILAWYQWHYIMLYAVMFCKATNVILIANAYILSSLSGVFSKDITAIQSF